MSCLVTLVTFIQSAAFAQPISKTYHIFGWHKLFLWIFRQPTVTIEFFSQYCSQPRPLLWFFAWIFHNRWLVQGISDHLHFFCCSVRDKLCCFSMRFPTAYKILFNSRMILKTINLAIIRPEIHSIFQDNIRFILWISPLLQLISG